MKINFKIDHQILFGQTMFICGSASGMGCSNENNALPMECVEKSKWFLTIDVDDDTQVLDYYYLIKENNNVISKEWGKPRSVQLAKGKDFYVQDYWRNTPSQKFLYTSAFSESFFNPEISTAPLKYFKESVMLKVRCPYVSKNQVLIMTGESELLGDWQLSKAIQLQQVSYAEWVVVFNASKIKNPLQYKFAIYSKETNSVVYWEDGFNQVLFPLSDDKKGNVVEITGLDFRYDWMNWKTSGVAIPVFSLRSKDSFGIGEFSDIKKLVDWAKKTGMKMIQILPINDTTITHKWTDSYPYNAISIYALHPVYLGIHEFPLNNKSLWNEYKKRAAELNVLKEIDYEKVLHLKESYVKDLFKEKSAEIFQSVDFKDFYAKNESWLFPYACFTYFRDKYETADYMAWKEYNTYSKDGLNNKLKQDKQMKSAVELAYFVQYLLHIQLKSVKNYAHINEVVLKGDIPIGISRASVEAWVEPHLFNMDTQTGAPPDDFSVNGQNWGFPTYNWDEMAKDGYQWWVKRFTKMADYFDAYRIDHILGFFRIWEIPLHSVQGLLGYFSPALPFTVEEINQRGLWFDEYRMTRPYIHEHFLQAFFGEYVKEVIESYLNPISWQRYELKDFCDTQQKVKKLFEGKTDEKSNTLRNGLYGLCNEVLFVRDKREPSKYHPRITAQFTYSFMDLDDAAKGAFNSLYDHFFYQRHNQFWRDQAMKKLPALISSTDMLVCGEDLGMIPDCVPSVMHEQQILSLEIQRMPKDPHVEFTNLHTIPYMSVCTTSTHDMSPIRAWWKENKQITQQYYSGVLWKEGPAPDDCTPEICWQILMNHLNSPAMLAIIPLQDWLSMDGELRRENPEDERINIPAVPEHYWRYRMHLTLEDLLDANNFNNQIKTMIHNSNR